MRPNVVADKSAPPRRQPAWPNLFAIGFLTIAISLIYGARLRLQPLVGEETRWATGAREMLATGDWVVPRQQGHVFPERPPMTMWLMAIGGWLRGDVDSLAIRLPSVVAVVLTSLLIYSYVRTLFSQTAAFVAALVYATFGQVLQIGRLGESEAVFALFVSASLLLWHLGYIRGWRPLVVWSIGFSCAALAALVKGPQAPVYFVAITGAYLLVRRDWRYLLSWQAAAGALLFIAIVGAWQFPFYRATDWAAVVATWAGLAADRFSPGGVFTHAFTYPLETFACLLPWSPLLVSLAHRKTRELLADARPVTTFLLTAIVVAYPTVWLAAGARGRYFMPLYPLIAVLIGLVIERCSQAVVGRYPRRAWHQFLLLWSVIIGAGALAVGASALMPDEIARSLYQPRWFRLVFAILGAGALYVLWKCFRAPTRVRPAGAVMVIAGMAGLGVAGILVNVNAARWTDAADIVAELRKQLPPEAQLVSFTPIEHRFAYYYGTPIPEFDWPRTTNDLPPDLDYFCFMRYAGDTAECRAAGRGRKWYTTPGTLPFVWEELDAICVDRQINRGSEMIVVLGRVVRPLQPAISDATAPQRSTAQHPGAIQR